MNNLELLVAIALLLIPYSTLFYKSVSISVRLSFTIVLHLLFYLLMILWVKYVKDNPGVFMLHNLLAAIGIVANTGLIVFIWIYKRLQRT